MRKLVSSYHRMFKRKGIYTLAWQSSLRLLVIVFIFLLLLSIAQSHINDFNEIIKTFLQKWDATLVLSLFFVSETLLGIIPPDFFIVWSKTTDSPIIMLTVLAILSYSGGMLSYFIGKRIAAYPRINTWLTKRFSSHFATLHKYGGFLIVFSALFPLPFSSITMVSGMIDYPFKKLSLLGLTRLLRFFLYAIVLFKLI